jgi:hypothetical protein
MYDMRDMARCSKTCTSSSSGATPPFRSVSIIFKSANSIVPLLSSSYLLNACVCMRAAARSSAQSTAFPCICPFPARHRRPAKAPAPARARLMTGVCCAHVDVRRVHRHACARARRDLVDLGPVFNVSLPCADGSFNVLLVQRLVHRPVTCSSQRRGSLVGAQPDLQLLAAECACENACRGGLVGGGGGGTRRVRREAATWRHAALTTICDAMDPSNLLVCRPRATVALGEQVAELLHVDLAVLARVVLFHQLLASRAG